ncbi:MAG: aldo/keto reductase [Bacillota bacterium]|nr:aldo/keto reductase [Bacillota bacterium]
MIYRTLGKTGLEVSLISLGSGGHSRIGLSTGRTTAESVAVVRYALEQGINLIDSSEIYGTEELVGRALSGWSRYKIILSTKGSVTRDDKLKTARQLEEGLESSLRRLQTDYIDIYHLHAVRHTDYDYVFHELVPAMQKMKRQGKIHSIGITEAFASDTTHKTLQLAVKDDCWDVMMVGFNLLNQSARTRVIEPAMEKNIGILDMFAVRKALINAQNLAAQLSWLIDKGLIDPDSFDIKHPLADVLASSGCHSLTELAYRFCCSEPGIHSILSGTGNIDHLKVNIRDIARGPLPEAARDKLIALFARVDCISGQ